MEDQIEDTGNIADPALSHVDGVEKPGADSTEETITEPVGTADVPRETADVPRETADVPRETADAPREIADAADAADAADDAVADAQAALVGFDPALHLTNPDGTPRLTKKGAYMRKRGPAKGSTPKSKAGDADLFVDTVPAPAPAPAAVPAPAAAPAPASAAAQLNNRAVAAMLVTTCTTLAEKVIGPEWKAEKDEAKALTDAARVYLDSIGGVEISPGAALAIAVVGYSLPRLAVPNTQTKLQKLGVWVSSRVAWVRGRFGI